jgi:acetylornithine deacetylase/succinyl-diaminopimelate desuccinylase-like protein
VHVPRSLSLAAALLVGATLSLPAQQRAPADAATVAEARSLLETLVATNTTYAKGTAAAARLLAERFRAAGWPAADVEVVGGSPKQQNLVVRWRAASPVAKPVLFMSHLDVVEAKREDWSSDPFTLRAQDGYLYGRGVLDDKAAVAAWTAALISLRREGWRPSRDITLVLGADEETAAESGVDWLVRNRRAMFDVDFILNADAAGPKLQSGEVTSYDVDVAEKASALIDLIVANPGGHSSRPRTDNAIYALARALLRVEQLRFPAELSELQRAALVRAAGGEAPAVAGALRAILRDPRDFSAAMTLAGIPYLNALVRTTCVATELAGGHAPNALPQRAAATVNCRILPGVAPESVAAKLRRVIADTSVHVVLRPMLRPSTPQTAMREDVRSMIDRAVRQTWGPRVDVQYGMTLGATDGSFTRAAGVPTYTILHVPSDPADMRAHGKDERILAKSFDESVAFARTLIREVAGPTR